jgi:hypothetical protein
MRATRIRQHHTVRQFPDPALGPRGKHLHQSQLRETGEIDRIRPGEERGDQDLGPLGTGGQRATRLEAQRANAIDLGQHADSVNI